LCTRIYARPKEYAPETPAIAGQKSRGTCRFFTLILPLRTTTLLMPNPNENGNLKRPGPTSPFERTNPCLTRAPPPVATILLQTTHFFSAHRQSHRQAGLREPDAERTVQRTQPRRRNKRRACPSRSLELAFSASIASLRFRKHPDPLNLAAGENNTADKVVVKVFDKVA